MAKNKNGQPAAVSGSLAIAEIRVAGFKSIREEQSIEIRPLTILAGANSSGKSSMMQPVLLLKQTLEASYDPGALLLNGPNVKFTSADQLLSRTGRGHSQDAFSVGMQLNADDFFKTTFRKEDKVGVGIEQMELSGESGAFTLTPEMSHAEIVKSGVTQGSEYPEKEPRRFKVGHWAIIPTRCFLDKEWLFPGGLGQLSLRFRHLAARWEETIPEIIHLPGLRGNPERAYPVAAVTGFYPGTFENYTASVISQWTDVSKDILDELNADLKLLKLASGVSAIRVNDVQVELYVGRLPNVPPTRPADRVNIADVGVGVSQTLPVLVALHAARPQQLVYVEQPETHLHPRAQVALAEVLANAAKRGVRIVVETHSSLLLLGVQTLVAEGKLHPDLVKLHWFQREKDGRTMIRSAELDEAGRFGEWPADFDDVELHSQKQYLDAAEKRLFAQ